MNTPIRKREPLPWSSEWTFEHIELYHVEIARIAGEFGLETFPVILEIITAEQMLDKYSSVGLPLTYPHWSYGKQFLKNEGGYRRGEMGLAYEIVINSDPCIAYLMEENTMTMQALVIAHAAYGHNSFFKGNELFRTWTSPDAIVDYMVFARNYITECEEKYGEEEVELFLDSCHALMNYGVDRYKHPKKRSVAEERRLQKEREAYEQAQVNDLDRTLTFTRKHKEEEDGPKEHVFPPEPQENLLYFFEKNSPLLEKWQREVIRIVRKIAQYFYPQRQTQVMNEGWATFWHYTILQTMYDRGLLADGFMFEFLKSHTSVVFQPGFDHPFYSGINPYALGFNMMVDIRRICEGGTWLGGKLVPSTSEQLKEDREWFPDLVGTDWLASLKFAMVNFKDESFIRQYLSPKLMREFKFFNVFDRAENEKLVISAIHDEEGYRQVREALSDQYNLSLREPNIQVVRVDVQGKRSLTLLYTPTRRRELEERDDSTKEMMKHVARLWGQFKLAVRIDTVVDDETGETKQLHYWKPPK